MSGLHNNVQTIRAFAAWVVWKSKGASDELAAALVANEDRETSFKPDARGDIVHSEPTAGGPGQQHEARRENIKANTGIDVWLDSHPRQIEALYQEMSASWSPYRKIWPALLTAKTYVEANAILVVDYEQSLNHASDIAKQNDKASFWLQYAKANWSGL